MKKCLVSCCFTCIGKIFILSANLYIQPAFAVDNLRLTDIRSLGMGGNEVTQSSLSNPALITLHACKSVGTDYINRYSVKELGTVHIGFQYPNIVLPASVDIFSFGYDKYRETMFRVSVGKLLNEKWRVGIGIQYAFLQTDILEDVPKRLSIDMGLLYSPVDKLFIGLLIMNFPSISLNPEKIEIKDFTDYSVQIGFQWDIMNRLLIAGTAGTDKETTITGSAGMEYIPFDKFRIRAGIKLSPLLPSMGIGYSFYRFTVDVAVVYHSVLGISSGLGLKYTF